GLTAMLVLADYSKWLARTAAGAIALIGSLMSSGIGLAFLAAVGIELIFDRRRWRMLVALLPPVLAYGIWFLTYGRGQPGAPGLSADFRGGIGLDYAVRVLDFLVRGLESSAG